MMSMEFLFASGIGWVVAVGIYLLLRGRSFAVVLGLTLIGYAVERLHLHHGPAVERGAAGPCWATARWPIRCRRRWC